MKINYFIFNKWYIIEEDIIEEDFADIIQDVIDITKEDIIKISKLLEKYKWWYVLYQVLKYYKIKLKK